MPGLFDSVCMEQKANRKREEKKDESSRDIALGDPGYLFCIDRNGLYNLWVYVLCFSFASSMVSNSGLVREKYGYIPVF